MTHNARIAVVTGANRGIGLEIARQLASRGVRVVGTARDEEKAAKARETLSAQGLEVAFLPLDVADGVSVRAFAKRVEQEFGRLDILVNNAGVFLDQGQAPLDLDIETLRATMEANAYGPLRLAQALAPLLKASENGRVVNLSSQMGRLSDMGGGYLAYRTSKAALNAITRVLAAELKADGVCVNSMCPGWVKTDMGGEAAPRTVEQGADTAVWLALDAPAAKTGHFYAERKETNW